MILEPHLGIVGQPTRIVCADGSVEQGVACVDTALQGLCEQCPAKSWMEHGSLDTPVEYLCEIAHAQASYFGLLKDDDRAWEITDWQERIRRFVGEEPIQLKRRQAEIDAERNTCII